METNPYEPSSKEGLIARIKTARKLAKLTRAFELALTAPAEPPERATKLGRSTVTIAHTH